MLGDLIKVEELTDGKVTEIYQESRFSDVHGIMTVSSEKNNMQICKNVDKHMLAIET